VEARAPGCRPWERISMLFAFCVSSRSLDQSILKNACFLEKKTKNRLSVHSICLRWLGAPHPDHEILLPLTITTLPRSFLTLNVFMQCARIIISVYHFPFEQATFSNFFCLICLRFAPQFGEHHQNSAFSKAARDGNRIAS